MEPYEALEKELGEWCGSPNVVVCSSGTSALQLALTALRLPKGSKVIVPEFTMIACARAVTMAGLVPVFIDCGEDLLLDVEKLEEVYSRDVSAIMPVHIYGRQCNMQAIHNFIHKYYLHKLKVIEDTAEGHGIKPHPKTDATCWSFYENKIIAGEEGGAVAFRSEKRKEIASQLRSLGFDHNHNFLHIPGGFNCRLSNANALPIRESLAQVETNLHKRKQVCLWYSKHIPAQYHMPMRDVCWVYDLWLPFHDANTEGIVSRLNEQGIEARLAFKPMSQQPEYRQPYKHLRAHIAAQRVIYMPVCPNMPESTVQANVAALLLLL